MPLTHILVDFDNKQPTIEELSQLSSESQRLWIFSSPHSGKFKADYVQALLAHDGRAQLVHCTKAGKNAVDLHIALHMGRLIADKAAADSPPNGDDFVVVSGDKDFVPLLEFVRRLGFTVRQVKSLKDALGSAKASAKPKKAAARPAAVPSTKAASKTTAKPAAAKKAAAVTPAGGKAVRSQSLDSIIDSLRKSPSNRPGSVAALGKWLVARKVAQGEVSQLIDQLAAGRVLRVEDKKVIYEPEPWPAKA